SGPLPPHQYTKSASDIISVPGQPEDRVIIVTVIPEMLSGGTVVRSAGPHQVIATTPRSQSTWDQAVDLWKMVRDLAPQLGSAAVNLFTSLSEGGFATLMSNLEAGLTGALSDFVSGFQTSSKKAFFEWLGAGSTTLLSNLANANFDEWEDIKAFLLGYAGLTWDNVQAVMLQELGAGNVAAVTKIYDDYFA
ncbi:hypothetical protein R5W24_006643, partial [Gemmata sp. JC717]|uniref:hypothetical protein n=1 Tax=Gemmata algarum TaxID=2975278 RepID=UPI0021BAA79F